jgi:hypothetical protein
MTANCPGMLGRRGRSGLARPSSWLHPMVQPSVYRAGQRGPRQATMIAPRRLRQRKAPLTLWRARLVHGHPPTRVHRPHSRSRQQHRLRTRTPRRPFSGTCSRIWSQQRTTRSSRLPTRQGWPRSCCMQCKLGPPSGKRADTRRAISSGEGCFCGFSSQAWSHEADVGMLVEPPRVRHASLAHAGLASYHDCDVRHPSSPCTLCSALLRPALYFLAMSCDLCAAWTDSSAERC